MNDIESVGIVQAYLEVEAKLCLEEQYFDKLMMWK